MYLSRLSLWDSVGVYKDQMLPGNNGLLGRTEGHALLTQIRHKRNVRICDLAANYNGNIIEINKSQRGFTSSGLQSMFQSLIVVLFGLKKVKLRQRILN